jgi:hypothetical protein
MKTRVKNFLKLVTMLTFVSTVLVSCGDNKNTSGGSKSSGYSYPSVSTSGNGMSLPSNWLSIVQSENPCRTGSNSNNRTRVVVPLNGVNVNAGAYYTGVTPEGDVGIVSNQSGGPVMEVYICQRPDLTGQGSLMNNPVLSTSYECPIGEITRTNIALQGQYGTYNLSFAPINIIGTDRRSSLCQNYY